MERKMMPVLLVLLLAASSPLTARECSTDFPYYFEGEDSDTACLDVGDPVKVLIEHMTPLYWKARAMPGSTLDFPVQILYTPDSEFPNAAAAAPRTLVNPDPVGKIAVNQGMLDMIGKTGNARLNTSETAFILAHELGHLALGHSQAIDDCKRKKLNRRDAAGKSAWDRWWEANADRLDAMTSSEVAKAFYFEVCPPNPVTKKRLDLTAFEHEADAFAMKLVSDMAYWVPAGERLFKRIRTAHPMMDVASDDHPPISDRIQKLNAWTKTYMPLAGADVPDLAVAPPAMKKTSEALRKRDFSKVKASF